MTAATDPTPNPRPAPAPPPSVRHGIDASYSAHRDADAPTTSNAAPAPTSGAAPVRRTVSMWIASAIALVAFLLGSGVSLLVGPLGGPPDGGPGGTPPAASTSQTTGTGT